MKYLIALLATVTVASSQNVLETFVSGSCDTVALMVPIASTKADVMRIMSTKGMKLKKAKPHVETYTDNQVNLMVVVQYKQGLASSVFLYLRYESPAQAIAAADVVNAAIEENHGEADPKLKHYKRRCYTATYALRATTIAMDNGHYLLLSIIDITGAQ